MKSFSEFSKSLTYHLENKIPLSESVFRYGSQGHFDLINEARELQDSLDLSEADKEILATDIGRFGIYEGKEVPLDLPFLQERHVYHYKYWGVIDPKGKVYPSEKSDVAHVDIFLRLQEKLSNKKIGIKYGWTRWFVDDVNDMYVEAENLPNESIEPVVKSIISLIKFHKNCNTYYVDIQVKGKSKTHRFAEDFSGIIRELTKYKNGTVKEELSEAEYHGKEVELGKPKRGGPKKYYVYVKNNSGNIIKVSFGDTSGLKEKITDPAARKSFVARHQCHMKKDKTKPGYWACRLPYYAKSLGLSGGGNFFW